MRQDCTTHLAKIKHCSPQKAVVVFQQNSACSGCHAAHACTMMDRKQREVEVFQDTSGFEEGEIVYLHASDSMGLKAVLLAFIFPLIVVLVVTFVAIQTFHWKELYAILLALGSLVLYYFLLSFFRKSLQRTITFSIQKINNPH